MKPPVCLRVGRGLLRVLGVDKRNGMWLDKDMSTTHIDGTAIVTLTSGEHTRFATEAEAVAWAEATYGPRLLQVTLVANTTDPERWAIRHWTENGDSGWRLWNGPQFLGGGELSDLTT